MQHTAPTMIEHTSYVSRHTTILISLDSLLATQSRFAISAFSLLLIVFVGAIDLWTGPEISFSVFYLLPIGIASWYLKGISGFSYCAVSIVVWFGVDMASGADYSNTAIPYWNAGVRLGFFIIVAYLLMQMRASLEMQATLGYIDLTISCIL